MRQLLPGALVLLVGCSSGKPSALSAPRYDPTAMASAAMSQLDRDKNGQLDAAELDACPGLKSILTALDTNRDKKLSTDELTAHFETYRAAGAGAVSVQCTVTLDGQPLAGATLTWTPEPFMLDAVRTATATTSAEGSPSEFRIGSETLPGLPCGVYRIAVSKKDGNREVLPEKYNARSVLGAEVSANPRSSGASIDLKLSSR